MKNHDIDALRDYPKHDKILTLNWDKFILTADWHLPFLNKQLFKKLILTSQKQKIRKLFIAGDFFDLNAFAFFFGHSKVPWEEEKNYARKVIDILRQFFTDIYFICANHEIRWLKALQNPSQGSMQDLYELIGVMDKDHITLKQKAIVGNWFICHPKNARKIPLSLGRELSNIHKNYHICVTHGHMQCLGKDPSNKYWLLDLGMMGDAAKCEYKNYSVTPHYEWQSGFAVVEGDKIDLIWE